MLKFSDQIEYYDGQPLTIEYQYQGKTRKYTPDFLIKYKPTPVDKEPLTELVEIKYSQDLIVQEAELKPKFDAAKEYCKQFGWKFCIRTEEDIRTDYLENIKFLLRYKSLDMDLMHLDYILRTMSTLRETTPQELLASCWKSATLQAEMLPYLWYMIANNKIQTDLGTKINMKSRIWMADLDNI